MTRWLPRGLSARIIGLTLIALLVSQLVGYLSFLQGQDRFINHMMSGAMVRAIYSANHSLQYARPGHEADLVRSLSSRDMHYALLPQLPSCNGEDADSRRYATTIGRRLNVSAARIRVCIGADVMRHGHGRSGLALAVAYRRDDGRWLAIHRRLPSPADHWVGRALRNMLITLAIMIVMVVLATRRFTRPLRELAVAAERFGRGEKIEPLAERGSDEIKRSIIEFNRMHERIDRFVAERTRLVAALAHDLRTPITALRLRLEFLPDDDNTRAMQATLNDLVHMSEATLDFMREETSAETARRMDLTALIDAVCEDYRAAEQAVTFAWDERVTLVCRPVAIRRALRNVIDNALAYGGSAEVSLADGPEQVVIDIADHGPGIDEAKMESVFDAFVRLETSRNRETGGAGLGLSIVRSIVRAHGGDVLLRNRPEMGLLVRITLPRAWI